FAPPLSYFLPDVAAVKGCLLSYLGFAQIIFQSFLKLLYKFTSCHKDLLILQRSDHRRTASAMPPYPRSSPAHPPAHGALPYQEPHPNDSIWPNLRLPASQPPVRSPSSRFPSPASSLPDIRRLHLKDRTAPMRPHLHPGRRSLYPQGILYI